MQLEQSLKQCDAACGLLEKQLHGEGPSTGQQAGHDGTPCMQMGCCKLARSGSFIGSAAAADSGTIAGAA